MNYTQYNNNTFGETVLHSEILFIFVYPRLSLGLRCKLENSIVLKERGYLSSCRTYIFKI